MCSSRASSQHPVRAGLKPPQAQRSETIASVDEQEEFPEGKVLYRHHRARERRASLREKIKAAAIKSGRGLACAACGFDFAKTYGEVGQGYIECHHTAPVCPLGEGAKTKLKDVALLCSTCHRIVHRRRPWLSIDNLRTLIPTR